MTNTDVKSYADRIGQLEDEKDTLTVDISEVYKEAEANGIDKKALRQAMRAKRKEIELAHKVKVNEYLAEIGELPLFSIA